jgi:hypothetical protein
MILLLLKEIILARVPRSEGVDSGSSAAVDISTPMRRIRPPCCAGATSGHATAAPPRSAMNSRRFRRSNCMRFPASLGRITGYPLRGGQSAGTQGRESRITLPPLSAIFRMVSIAGLALDIAGVFEALTKSAQKNPCFFLPPAQPNGFGFPVGRSFCFSAGFSKWRARSLCGDAGNADSGAFDQKISEATRLSDDPQCYWQPPRRRPPSRGVLVCRRHLRFFRQVADTSPPRAEGNHPNPYLALRVKTPPDGLGRQFARGSAPAPPNRSGTYLIS